VRAVYRPPLVHHLRARSFPAQPTPLNPLTASLCTPAPHQLHARAELPRDAAVSHVVVALRGRATRNSRLGTYATKFADARLAFLTADQC
jgi:hypothetical protein